jgi:hypothetical protein
MELRQLVSTYVDELESPTNAWGQSIHTLTLPALRDRFGQSATDSAIDAELTSRNKQRDDGRRCPIPKTRSEVIRQCIADIAPDGVIRIKNKPSDECNRLGDMFAN